jgi:hypothetical protein
MSQMGHSATCSDVRALFGLAQPADLSAGASFISSFNGAWPSSAAIQQRIAALDSETPTGKSMTALWCSKRKAIRAVDRMSRVLGALTISLALTGCGGEDVSKIYGVWKRANDQIEFTDKSITISARTSAGRPHAASYEMKDGKVIVTDKEARAGMSPMIFRFKSATEICSDDLSVMGCFTKQ